MPDHARPWLVTLLACAMAFSLTLVAPSLAHANKAAARAAFQQGRKLFQKGAYAEAVKELKKAYALSPHPALLRYLGQTYYKWSKAKEALQEFERYLKEAPQAPDRAQIEEKVAELKKLLTAPKEPPASQGAKKPEPKIDLRPTGEDTEMPDVFKKPATGAKTPGSSGEGMSFLTIAKWTSAGLAVGGLAMGIVFNVLASGKASELEDAVTGSGNPDKNSPKVAFNAGHFDLEQAYKRNNTIAIASYVIGGVFTAAAVALFIVDQPSGKSERKSASRAHDLAVAPSIAPGFYGVAGSISF